MKILYFSIFCFTLLHVGSTVFLDDIPTSPIRDGQFNWKSVDAALQNGVDIGAFPGCVALVGNEKGVLYYAAFGNFTYGDVPPNNKDNPAMKLDTLFDIASLSKVTGATSAIAQFYQRGEIRLDTRISDILGEKYTQNGKENVTILNCLLHNAGYPADPSPSYADPSFGCPESQKYHPEENFSCQDKIYEGLLAQTLINPIGSTYIYSDLSYITLMYVVGTLAKNLNYVQPSEVLQDCLNAVNPSHPATSQCYFEAYLRKHVFQPLGMKSTAYLPKKTLWNQCAPCENDTDYLHRVIQGQVSDGNAYALGGISGHAGIFSNVFDLHKLMHRVLFADEQDHVFINQTTAKLFTTEYNHTQSSRALGWNTNDPAVFDQGWGLVCGNLSSKTFMHLGYTGTQMCGDPVRNIYTILFTNRVYPSASNTQIQSVRKAFNNAVVSVVDALYEDQISMIQIMK